MQMAMSERIKDIRWEVRLQAVEALVRLQEPSDLECPAIRAYLQSIYDPHPQVRKEVVLKMAPTLMTAARIVERIRDVNEAVRHAAFLKCAQMGPKLIRIIDRRAILLQGFVEEVEKVKNIFEKHFLPKWLHFYNGNFIEFIKSINLDADENDMQQTAYLSEKIMQVLFR